MFVFELIFFGIFHSTWSISPHPILIIVSYDGFRHDYLQANNTPNLLKLRQQGTYAEYVHSVFPTKSFPNHFTIATGLYPETHGVVGNSFYDPDLKKIVKIEPDMFSQKKDVIPIWLLNELSAEDRYSGSMMWPGSEYPFKNRKPTYFEAWDLQVDLLKRVDKVIEWLTDKSKPANLIMLYTEMPDHCAHVHGPNSDEVREKLKEVDKAAKYLDDELHKHELRNLATVVYLSDHGMAEASVKNTVNITRYLEPDSYTLAEKSALLYITPKEGQVDGIYYSLKRASEVDANFDVYKKEEYPEKWHFKNNPRIPPILLISKDGHAFEDIYKRYENRNLTPTTVFGLHGYDPDIKKMCSFFMIRGPNVYKNKLMDPFANIDLFNLFAKILKVEAPPNNGTQPIFKDMLISQAAHKTLSAILRIINFYSYSTIFLKLLEIGLAKIALI